LQTLQELRSSGWYNPGSYYHPETREDVRDRVIARVPTQNNTSKYRDLSAKDFWVGRTDSLGLERRGNYTFADTLSENDQEEANRQALKRAARDAAAEKELTLRRDALMIEERHPEVKNSRPEAYGFVKVFTDYVVGDKVPKDDIVIGDKVCSKSDLSKLKAKYRSDYDLWLNGYHYTNYTIEQKPKAADYFDDFVDMAAKTKQSREEAVRREKEAARQAEQDRVEEQKKADELKVLKLLYNYLKLGQVVSEKTIIAGKVFTREDLEAIKKKYDEAMSSYNNAVYHDYGSYVAQPKVEDYLQELLDNAPEAK